MLSDPGMRGRKYEIFIINTCNYLNYVDNLIYTIGL